MSGEISSLRFGISKLNPVLGFDLTFASGKGILFDTYGIKITDTIQFGNDTDAWESRIKNDNGNILIRNAADNAYGGLYCALLGAESIYMNANAAEIKASGSNDRYAIFQAWDTGVGQAEVARLQGAADPYFATGNNGNASKSYYSGVFEICQGVKIATTTVTKAHDSDLFAAEDTSDDVTIWQQPAGSVLLGAKITLDTQFAADSLSDLDVTVGLAGDNDGLIAPTMNGTSDSAGTDYSTRGEYWNTSAEGSFWYAASATDWVAYATATGANLSTTSAGQVTFTFTYLEMA